MRVISWPRGGPGLRVALFVWFVAAGVAVLLGTAAAASTKDPRAGSTATTTSAPPTSARPTTTTVPLTTPTTKPASKPASKPPTTTTASKPATKPTSKPPTTTTAPTTTTTEPTTTTTAPTTTTTAPASKRQAKKGTASTAGGTTTVPPTTVPPTTVPGGGTAPPRTVAPATTVPASKAEFVPTSSSRPGAGKGSSTGGRGSTTTTTTHGTCGRTPLGPVSDGQTVEASGKITLTTPVILKDCADVTITGGTWDDPNTDPGKGYGGGTGAGRPAFEVVGGTDVTVEDLSIVGANRGGYHSRLAFNGGVETEGTSDLTVSDVKVSHVFGDCLTLDPLRSGAGTNGIVAPVRGLTVDGFSGTACGRQGISLASVDGAVLHDVSIGSTGFDSFDAEADQSGREGVRDLTLDGCAFSGLFAITAGGGATGPITVTDCTMSGTGSGDVLMVRNTSGVPDAGAITLSDDTLRCGASVYVSCFQLAGASDVMVEKSTVTIGYRHDAIHEAAYHLSGATHVTFVDDTVAGFGRMGTVGAGSNATVSGGTWKGLSCRAAAVCPAR